MGGGWGEGIGGRGGCMPAVGCCRDLSEYVNRQQSTRHHWYLQPHLGLAVASELVKKQVTEKQQDRNGYRMTPDLLTP